MQAAARSHRAARDLGGSLVLVSFETLIDHLEHLDHRERVAGLVAHARGLRPDELDGLLGVLLARDAHHRWLALQVMELRRDAARAWAMLDDPSLSVRSLAAKLVGRYASEVPASAVDRLDAHALGRLLAEVVARRRSALAQTLAGALVERGRLREAACVLPACAVPFVEARLREAAWPEIVWTRLAKHQPTVVCAAIERAFTTAERPDLVWRRHSAAVWVLLCQRAPATVARWIERFAEADSLPAALVRGGGLSWLVRFDPAQVLRWLSTRLPWLTQNGLPRGLAAHAYRVDDDALAPVCQGLARSSPASLGPLLARLPYPRRARLFERATEALDTTRIEWPTALLAVLPTWLRDREAARMLGLARASTDGSWRRELLGLRAIEAARPELEREGQSSQAVERGEAHAALVLASMRSRDGMPQTLAWLRRIRNEQDPVRMAVLGALARVPGHCFHDPEALDAVIRPIFEARDTSYATRSHAARIAHALLVSRATEPASPMFALGLDVLERLAGHAGVPDLPRLDRNLPRGAERAIVLALRPWVEAARARQQTQHLLRLWAALGKRAWRVPELAELVADAIWHANKNQAGQAASLWVQDPKTRDERVRALVERDRSALYLHPVFEHCHRRRQSLLVERLAATAPRGRFHDGKLVIVPYVARGFTRWSTALQRAYVELIALAELEPKQFGQTRASLVAMRARVPITTAADLADALASSDVNVQEAALGALVWLDDPSPALHILLEHLDGDRARVAMYALPRLQRLVPRDRFVEALASVLDRPRLKVTVHKEALRLLGELATPRAVELLRRTWQQPLHRDVRIAALHAARSILGEPDAWPLLESAACDESHDVARAVVEVPLSSVAEPHRARYLAVMLKVADHPSPDARAALFGALASEWSLVDPGLAVGVAIREVARMELADPWKLAVSVIAEGACSPATHAAIVELVAGLVATADRDVAPAAERDRLAHRRLAHLCEALEGIVHPGVAGLRTALAERLLAQPHWWALGAGLRVAATPNDRLAATLVDLLAGAPSTRSAGALERAARRAAARPSRDWSAADAERCTSDLVAGSPAARLLAVAWIAELGPRWGWSAAWSRALHRLRDDDDLDVRIGARAVWMATDSPSAS